MSYMENKVVLITGGGNGIGRAAAEVFAREGANVLITGRRAAALEEVTASNPAIQGFVADAADSASAGAAVEHAVKLWRSEEHTSELQSLMRISYAVFCF